MKYIYYWVLIINWFIASTCRSSVAPTYRPSVASTCRSSVASTCRSVFIRTHLNPSSLDLTSVLSMRVCRSTRVCVYICMYVCIYARVSVFTHHVSCLLIMFTHRCLLFTHYISLFTFCNVYTLRGSYLWVIYEDLRINLRLINEWRENWDKRRLRSIRSACDFETIFQSDAEGVLIILRDYKWINEWSLIPIHTDMCEDTGKELSRSTMLITRFTSITP